MKYNLSQANSVFMPGLTRRGPVYNASPGFGDLPTLSPGVKFALEGGLLAAGLFKKIPLVYAIAGAALVYFMLPDTASAGAAANAASAAMPIDTSSLNTVPTLDISSIPMPTVGIPQS